MPTQRIFPKGGRQKWVLFMRFVLNRKKRSIHRFGLFIFVYLLWGHCYFLLTIPSMPAPQTVESSKRYWKILQRYCWSERCTGRKGFTLPNAACCTKQTQKYACKINLSLWFGGICIVLSVPVICDWHTSFGNG